MDQRVCSKCAATGEKIVLSKCPICFKFVCETCRVSRSGRLFCSQFCADHFFYGDEDE